MDHPSSPFTVLMVDDNEHDLLAAERAWKRGQMPSELKTVTSGEECLAYLRHEGAYRDRAIAPFPKVLVLDISMPGMSGLEVLEEIRADPTLALLPVVMLTTSQLEEDRVRSYQLGCNAYLRKPVTFDDFAEMIRRLHLFWEIVDVPQPFGQASADLA
ncbi:MAG: response regulator [Bacteroidota bacterium]